MNSLERIRKTLALESVDRVPVIPQIFGHAAVLTGRPLLDYVQSGAVAAECQLEALHRYGADCVFAALDVCIEAEAMGAEVVFRRDIYPAVEHAPLSTNQDLAALEVPDPTTAARMPQVLDAATRLRKAVGDETLLVGILQGPMTLALQCLGAETALYYAADEPVAFEALLDFNTELAIRFGLAQLEAGVHLPMVFEPGGSPEVVPPAFFRELLAPRIKRIFAAFREAGAEANWLHIAGQALPILPSYHALGADIGNFDYCVDPACLIPALGEQRLTVDGNLKPLSFVDGSPDEVEGESRSLLRLFEGRRGFILSSGCEIPPESEPENIAAMVNAVRDPGSATG